VDFHRARADPQFAPDHLVAAALGQPVEHFAFARGKHGDLVARFDHLAARLDMRIDILADPAKRFGKPFGFQRQRDIIQRPRFNRIDDAGWPGFTRGGDYRQPHALLSQLVQDRRDPAVGGIVARQDHPVFGWSLQEFGGVGIGFTVMAKSKTQMGLFCPATT
jgi:hypothetical protein